MTTDVLKGRNLFKTIYGGHAAIEDLPGVSRVDGVSQDSNPDGLQRDLTDPHADDTAPTTSGMQRTLSVPSEELDSSEPCAHPW